MNDFNRRTVTGAEILGERLRRVRNDAGIDIEVVAEDLRIRPEYIKAIEESNYTALPGSVFVKNYVRKYAVYLKLGKHYTEQLLREELAVYEANPDIPTTTSHLAKQPLQVRMVVILLAVIFGIVAVGSYVSFAVANIIQPPELYLDPIPEQLHIDDRKVTISGETISEATVQINDKSIDVTEDGAFSEDVLLQEGINVFKVVAKTKRSKERVEFRQVVVQGAIDNITDEAQPTDNQIE